MVDSLVRESVLDLIECDKVVYDISVVECPVFVFEGQFRSKNELDHICHSITHLEIQPGQMAASNGIQLLRFNPFSVYVILEQQQPAEFTTEHQKNFFDISHGKCMLTIQGESILEIVGDYCSADIFCSRISQNQMVKTRFIDYELVIWWHSNDKVNLLVDRSYLQSFVEFFRSLLLRR